MSELRDTPRAEAVGLATDRSTTAVKDGTANEFVRAGGGVAKPTIVRMYEGMFVMDPGRAGNSFEEALGHVKALLDRIGATLIVAKRWDERKLAYEIRGQKRGLYILVYFRADASKVVLLERDAQLSEYILRCLVLRRDKLTEEQAHAVKTYAELKEEEAKREKERAATSGPVMIDGQRIEEMGELPPDLADMG